MPVAEDERKGGGIQYGAGRQDRDEIVIHRQDIERKQMTHLPAVGPFCAFVVLAPSQFE